jgi:hypothetical protein
MFVSKWGRALKNAFVHWGEQMCVISRMMMMKYFVNLFSIKGECKLFQASLFF